MGTEICLLINKTICEIAAEQGKQVSSALNFDSVLLESGLDSLGFAILVARLEEMLGFDPFVIMKEAVYPRTFGDFVQLYEKKPASI